MNPRTLIRQTSAQLRAAGIEDPETDCSLILSHLCSRPPLELRLDMETELGEAVLVRYHELVRKRADRIPLQYLLGEAPFFGHLFYVDEHVLIPRPETELLCEWALDLLNGSSSPRVLDLCCGSGCIGLSVKAARPDARVTLADLSAEALNTAARNAAALGLEVCFHQGDLLDGFPPYSFDMILCNPPYIPSADCKMLQAEVLREPLLALDGGGDGLNVYRRLIPSSVDVLPSGGMLLMELGIGEAAAVSGLLSAHGFLPAEVRRDLAHIERMILAVRP